MLIILKVQKALVEMSRFYFRKNSPSKVYDLWILNTANSFFALHEIEVTTFLGLSAFCVWQKEINSESEPDSGSNSDSDSKSSGSESEESEESEPENENNEGNDIAVSETFKNKLKPNFKKKSYKAKLDKIRNERIFRITRMDKKVALSPSKRRSQNIINEIHFNQNNQDNPKLYAAREYLTLALQFNPACETSLMHLLFVSYNFLNHIFV